MKYSFFWKRIVSANLKKFLQTTSVGDMLLENFTLSNSTILLEDLMKWKRYFEMLLIDYYAGDIENKNVAGQY